MSELQVEGRVLTWVRKQRGISATTAAKRLRISETELLAIERSGRNAVRRGLLSKMARQYRVPYGTLFMPEPLATVRPRDYRTFRGRAPQLSEDTLSAWTDVDDAVDSFSELRAFQPALVPVQNLPQVNAKQNIEILAAAERARLRITLAQQYVWTEAQARDGWRAALESVGVFVYFVRMPRNDCMGFSVLDGRDIAAICVNDDEDLLEQQKIFTMLHEYCHLLLRRPGISDQRQGNVTERFCNQLAAAILVPRDALRTVLPGGGPHQDWSNRDLKRTANRFTVSMEVIALRIEELGMAKPGFHERKVREWTSLKLLQKRARKTHPNVTWPERAAKRLGRKHTDTVLGALGRGAISYTEARDLIGLSPRHFSDVKAAMG